jgi:uncharacterized protein YoxC
MTNEELVEKIGKLLEPIQKDLHTMKQVVTHISTGVEALGAGQQDVREQVKTLSRKVATKADVQEIKADLVKHQRRIENLEDNTSTPNPHKN